MMRRALMFPLVFLSAQCIADEARVEIASGEWRLVGDLNVPDTDGLIPAVLMLNQAAGNRAPYEPLARHLADRGIGSLRLDLPGHGESVNHGRFVPGEVQRDPKIWGADKDVVNAYEFLRSHEAIDATRIAIVGASYSGEEAAESGRENGYASAYVMLSPGSFSDQSIDGIDSSAVPWLFVTARDERFLQEIRAAVTERSESVEQIIVPGTGHATDLLDEFPSLAERIAAWISNRLR